MALARAPGTNPSPQRFVFALCSSSSCVLDFLAGAQDADAVWFEYVAGEPTGPFCNKCGTICQSFVKPGESDIMAGTKAVAEKFLNGEDTDRNARGAFLSQVAPVNPPWASELSPWGLPGDL